MKHKAEPTIACVIDPAGERTLVVAAKNGDEQALETLFKRYQRKTLGVVLRYTRVVEDAEDIVQQSFHKAFVHLCQFQGESSFSTWLTRIAINEALMCLRHIRLTREVSIDSIGDAEGSPGIWRNPTQTPTQKAATRSETKSGFFRRQFGVCARGCEQQSY